MMIRSLLLLAFVLGPAGCKGDSSKKPEPPEPAAEAEAEPTPEPTEPVPEEEAPKNEPSQLAMCAGILEALGKCRTGEFLYLLLGDHASNPGYRKGVDAALTSWSQPANAERDCAGYVGGGAISGLDMADQTAVVEVYQAAQGGCSELAAALERHDGIPEHGDYF
jgi:hypothetical protein